MPPAGRLGDRSKVPVDTHGCPACPHPAIGPAIVGSPNVNINGRPALRVGDAGIHTACCGTNRWIATTGSATVLINGRPAHRKDDLARHCGGEGKLIEGSGTVDHGGPSTSSGDLFVTALAEWIRGPSNSDSDNFEWAGTDLDELAFRADDTVSFGPTLEGYLMRGKFKIPVSPRFPSVTADGVFSGPSGSVSQGFSKKRFGLNASGSVASVEISKGPFSIGGEALGAGATVGFSGKSFGADIGANLVSAKGKAGPVTAEIGLKAELGFSIGKKTQVKLGPVSFGIEF